MKFELGVKDSRLQKWIDKVHQRVPKVMQFFMLEAYRQVTNSTPVDTGRAQWGWNCSIGKEDFTIPAEGEYSLDAGRASKVFIISDLKKSNADTLYICNAVPYIGHLNAGSSMQAPARFVELAFTNAVNKLRIYVNGTQSSGQTGGLYR